MKVSRESSLHILHSLCCSATLVTSLSCVSAETQAPNLFSTRISFLEPPQTSTVSTTRWCSVVSQEELVLNNITHRRKYLRMVLVCSSSLFVRPTHSLTDLVHKQMNSHKRELVLSILSMTVNAVRSLTCS